MGAVPVTRYIEIAGANVAYQVFGDGPNEVIFARPVFNHLELQWEDPHFAGLLNRLGTFGRVAVFDARGTGASDPWVGGRTPAIEEWGEDIAAVIDAVGFERPALVAASTASWVALLFVATQPDKVGAFVGCDPFARALAAPDYPEGMPEVMWHVVLEAIETEGTDALVHMAEVSDSAKDWFARYLRVSVSRGTAIELTRYMHQIDVRHVLGAIRVPTLIVAHTGNVFPLCQTSRYVAENIHGAEFIELPGRTEFLWRFPDVDAVADSIQEFVTGKKGARDTNRVLATVLFCDVVGSTAKAAELGDRKWGDVIETLESIVRRQIDRFSGRLVNTEGDGSLAIFDAPGRAIRCGLSLVESVRRIDLELRVGLHTGEIDLRGEEIAGLAVHIGSRVCASALGGEVTVSGSIPPLVVGSGFEFSDRGIHELRGVPGTWPLFVVSA